MKPAIRCAEFLDRTEHFLTRRGNDSELSRLWSFPAPGTPLGQKIGVRLLMKHALTFSLFLCILVLFLIVATSTVFGGFFLPSYQFHPFDYKEALLITKMLFRHRFSTLANPVLEFLIWSLSSIVINSPFHWAWNRRADRLNHEAALPQAAPVLLSSVWPPPPTRS